MIVASLMLGVVALLLSCPLTWLMARLGRRLGQMDQPGERKIHAVAVPATGGVAIFWAFAALMLAGLTAGWVVPIDIWERWLPAVAVHLPGLRNQTPMAVTLLFTVGAMHLVGLIDDRKNLGPFVKLIVQLAAAAALAIFFDVRIFHVLGPVGSVVVTVLWFGVIINAFNFLDNMNGLSAGTAVICGSILLAAALLNGQWFVGATLGLLVGAMLGFLVWNYPRAIIFMGDGGSLVVGFVMAFCSVRITYFEAGEVTGWWAVLVPIVVLAIPLYDLTSVTLIRLAQGKSPFQGDTQHFSHRLVRKGLRPPIAVAVIWACALATGLGGILLPWLEGWQAALVVIQTGAVVLVLAMLERTRPSSEAAS